jgi:NAD(P)-dependent dehydrogenase (short-subunit alcohol dehydrogenase family)
MKGKVVVATGATSGIGAVAVETLAKLGARIVFVARDRAKAEAMGARLEEIAPGLGHSYHLADLSLIAETKRVGAQIASREPRIDVLLNNAGAIFATRRVTAEGLEKTFALNHMSYFTLTKMLVERLKPSAPARIVSTASTAHFGAALDFDDLQSARGYSAMKAYGRSKLANILFTRELARRLTGTGVVANCQHPGFVATRFGDEAGGWLGRIIPLAKLFALSPTVGADTLTYLASDPQAGAVSGEYFVKRQPAACSRDAQNDQAAARLWEISEALFDKY